MYKNGRVVRDVETAEPKAEIWDRWVEKEYLIFECEVVKCVSVAWPFIEKQRLRKDGERATERIN